MIENINIEYCKPKRVVILGGSGFVGVSIQNLFREKNIDFLSISTSVLDLTLSNSATELSSILKDNDSLLFLSALTPDRGRDHNTFMSNLEMMRTVCLAVSNIQLSHIVYFSSDAVYPFCSTLVNEFSPAAPSDLYGAMHRSRELMLLSSNIPSPICILRPTLIYGQGDTHNSYGPNRFQRQAENGKNIILGGGGEETRDHIFIQDVVQLTNLVLGHRSRGILNVATGSSLSFRAIADKISKNFDTDITVQTTNRSSPITHRTFDVTNLIKAFPLFRFTSIDVGLAEFNCSDVDRHV